MLTLSFVTGTEPGKWFERFRERTVHGGIRAEESTDALGELVAGRVQLALTRLPDARIDAEKLHVVELYREEPGVALSKDNELTLLTGQLTSGDLADEMLNYRPTATGEVDISVVRDALQVVAANVGVAIAPRPLLKVLSKKQVEHRGYRDAEIVDTAIALVWFKDRDNDAIQDFIGIAKGRTVNSSRHAAPKRTAREKALAKQARRGLEKPKPRRRR